MELGLGIPDAGNPARAAHGPVRPAHRAPGMGRPEMFGFKIIT
jgi:hypothetical protein